MLKTTDADRVMTQARLISKHLRKSLVGSKEVAQIQQQMGKPVRILPKECATRWTSARALLERLYEMKDELVQYTIPTSLEHLRLSAADWLLVSELLKILDSVAVCTNMLQATESPTLGCVLPCIDRLLTLLDDVPPTMSLEGSEAMRPGPSIVLELLLLCVCVFYC